MKTQFQIRVTDPILRKAVFEKIEQLGYKWPYFSSVIDYNYCEYFIFGYNKNDHYSLNGALLKGEYPLLSIEEFFNMTKINEIITIQISEEYQAEISVDGIQVGCTSLSNEIVDKIIEAVKEVRK